MYQYADQGYKTAERVRQVLTEMYKPTPAGLCGNDDCGQMSAWYIFSAMGFYPMNAVSSEYVFGSPIIDKAVIKLENGKKFTIDVKNNSAKNIYIKSVKINDELSQSKVLLHSQIMNGGKLKFEMSAQRK
jgi:putative alpha-1,2-mannosidase